MANPTYQIALAFRVLIIVAIALGLSGHCLGRQETRKSNYEFLLIKAMCSNLPAIEYRMGFSGKFETRSDELGGILLERFFEDAQVHEVLELTAKEKKLLAEALRDFKARLKLASNSNKTNEASAGLEEKKIVDKSLESIDGLIEDLKEILPPKRLDRFFQLQAQALFLAGGLDNFLKAVEFFEDVEEMNPSAKSIVWAKIRGSEQIFCKEKQNRDLPLVEQTLDKIIQVLPPEHHAVVRKRWEPIYAKPGGLALLYLHLQPHREANKSVNETDFWEAFCSFPEIKASIFSEPFFDKRQRQQISEVNRLNFLGHAMMTPSFQIRLDIQPGQLAEYHLRIAEYHDYSDKINAEVGRRYNCPVNRIVKKINGVNEERDVYFLNTEEAKADFATEMNPVAKAYVKRIEDVLVDWQKQHLANEVFDIHSLRYGVRFDLLAGELSKTLGLSDRVNRNLEESFQEIGDDLREANNQSFVKDVELILESVGESESHKRLKRRFGEFPADVFYDQYAISLVWLNRPVGRNDSDDLED